METDKLILTEDQIKYFNKRGLKVPLVISISLLGSAELLVKGFVSQLTVPDDYHRELCILNFDDVIKKR